VYTNPYFDYSAELSVFEKAFKSSGGFGGVDTDYIPLRFEVSGTRNVAEGVYTFCINNCLLRMDTGGNIVFSRNLSGIGQKLAEISGSDPSRFSGVIVSDFQPHDTADGRFYTYFVELAPELRGSNSGDPNDATGRYASGAYVLLDENFNEIDLLTLKPNSDPNHTHGAGYLDLHGIILLGRDDYIAVSYLRQNGVDCIIQEVRDGRAIREFNLNDYTRLYQTVQTGADRGDYAHVNSVSVDPKDGALVVSLASQYAIYKLDRNTGAVIWILGGDDNQFDGIQSLNDYKGDFFDNPTGAAFTSAILSGWTGNLLLYDTHPVKTGNYSRILSFALDEEAKSLTYSLVWNFEVLDRQSRMYHWTIDFGSAELVSSSSFLAGWGYNSQLDRGDKSSEHPVFSEFDINSSQILFELRVFPDYRPWDGCFSQRVYKTAV